MSEIKMLKEERERVFDCGFFASGEGYNGEYPPPNKNDRDYLEMREEELKALIKENKNVSGT